MLEIYDHGTVIFTAIIAVIFCKIAIFVLNAKKTVAQKEARRTKSGAGSACAAPCAASSSMPAIVETRSRAAERSQRKLACARPAQAQRKRTGKASSLPEAKRTADSTSAAEAASSGSSDGAVTVAEPKSCAVPEAPSSPGSDEPTFTTTYDDVAVHAMAAAAAAAESAARTERTSGPELTPSMARRQRRKRMKQRAAADQPAPAEAPAVAPVPPTELQLDVPPEVLYQLARQYMLPPEQLHMLGFPHSSSFHRGKAYIYKGLSGSPRPTRKIKLDAAAKEFVPRALASSSDCDSGTHSSETGDDSSGSSGSEPPDEQQVPDDVSEPESVHSSGSETERPRPVLRPLCVRCARPFAVTPDGVYTDTTEKCVFHWGKLKSAAHGAPTYACCGGRPGARGCSAAACHVWSGLLPGLNGPLKGYVRTRRRRALPPDGNHGVYALDCEMCYTGQGLELARVSVVGVNGKKVYDALVQPERPVVDYNTRFSGITARQLDRVTKTLRSVQSDLMGFISADTVLVGHGLENDLRALRLVHDTVVDTSVLFPHYLGLPYRRRLSQLTSSCLGWSIQQDSGASGRGHDSLEDARACIQLLLWRTRRDLRLD